MGSGPFFLDIGLYFSYDLRISFVRGVASRHTWTRSECGSCGRGLSPRSRAVRASSPPALRSGCGVLRLSANDGAGNACVSLLIRVKRGLFWKRRTPDEERAERDIAFAAIHRLYCESLPLWRVCARGSCRRHHYCAGHDKRACLARGWPLMPKPVQNAAYAAVQHGGPLRRPPGAHAEWSLRQYPPSNFTP
jgi:hypothetical protein